MREQAVIALGYVRRSKESGPRTISLEDQRGRIEAYCHERRWRLADIMADGGVSGGRRERLERLAERVRSTGARFTLILCAGVLVTSISCGVSSAGASEFETPAVLAPYCGVQAALSLPASRVSGVPTVVPAVCNAVFGLTGGRIPKLPLEHYVARRT